jgi:outer membrane receptor for ferrienterochelin and colicins
MFPRISAIFLCFLFFIGSIKAQTIYGKVLDGNKLPIADASISWIGQPVSIKSDSSGIFKLEASGVTDLRIVASHAGCSNDTILASKNKQNILKLQCILQMQSVTIRNNNSGIVLSNNAIIKTEKITQKELKKAACCDLAGCFETQSTVQPQTTNVLTNAKELRILGLSGVYNQVLVDGFPLIQGLSYTYGISSLPGTLIDNIYVSKGANSVLQGFESISGQINVETKDPDTNQLMQLNGYMNNFQEKHLNMHLSSRIKSWRFLTGVHVVQPAKKIDRDADRFLDLPLLTRYMVMQKFEHGNANDDGWFIKGSVRYLNEKRIGGQVDFDPVLDRGGARVYGQTVSMHQPEGWIKSSYRINSENQWVGFLSAEHHQQASYFGTVNYEARQTTFYANLQFEHRYGAHELKVGASLRNLSLQENIEFSDTLLTRDYAGSYRRHDQVPGIFAENTLKSEDGRWTLLTGMRLDHHQQFGFRFTPRFLVKFDPSFKTTIRVNAGTGWRTVNLFSENNNLVSGSRNIIFSEPLRPESALNMGVNITQKYGNPDAAFSGYLSIDYYRTRFFNQVFPDYDRDPTSALIQNFDGKCVSNGFQAEWSLQWSRGLDLKVGYNFLDVYRLIGSIRDVLPFNPKHKVLSTLSYEPESKRYHIDLNVHWYGKQRLPNTRLNPIAYRRPDFSDPYTTFNLQYTHLFNRFEIYAGVENLFDFRQLQPIISWQQPFSPYFDLSSVWGPTRGREIYLGFRLSIPRKVKTADSVQTLESQD